MTDASLLTELVYHHSSYQVASFLFATTTTAFLVSAGIRWLLNKILPRQHKDIFLAINAAFLTVTLISSFNWSHKQELLNESCRNSFLYTFMKDDVVPSARIISDVVSTVTLLEHICDGTAFMDSIEGKTPEQVVVILQKMKLAKQAELKAVEAEIRKNQ